MNKLRRILSVVLIAAVIVAAVPVLSLEAKAANNPYAAWISVFDPTYYTANNAGAAAYAKGDINKLWQYFIQVGVPKGEQASSEFNVFIYAKNYPDLVKAFGGNMIQYYIHYAQKGKAQGLNAKTLNNGTKQSQASDATKVNKADPGSYDFIFTDLYDKPAVGFNKLAGYVYDHSYTDLANVSGGFLPGKLSCMVEKISWNIPSVQYNAAIYHSENYTLYEGEYYEMKYSHVATIDTSQGTVRIYLKEQKASVGYRYPGSDKRYIAFIYDEKNDNMITISYAHWGTDLPDLNAFVDFLKRSMNK